MKTQRRTGIISIVRNKETFDMFEAKFKCSNSFLNISLSKTENGPWSALNMKCVSDLYQAPVGVVFRTFPDTNYVKLDCVEEPDEKIQDQAVDVNPQMHFKY